MPAKEKCFVVGPIGAEGSDTRTHADWLYDGIIKPVLKDFSQFQEPIRADKIAQPGMITTQVIELLLDAKLVIADLSFLNPNAFYEVGIRHMAQKPIIHMQLKSEAPPFDVNGYRAIKFSVKHPSDLVSAQHELCEQVKIAIASDHRIENPVTHARGAIHLEQTATPEQKVLLEEMRSIGERLSALEKKPIALAALEEGRATHTFRVIYDAEVKPNREQFKSDIADALAAVKKLSGVGFRNERDGSVDVQLYPPVSFPTYSKVQNILEVLDGVRTVTAVLS